MSAISWAILKSNYLMQHLEFSVADLQMVASFNTELGRGKAKKEESAENISVELNTTYIIVYVMSMCFSGLNY